jgi:hypothetical protein
MTPFILMGRTKLPPESAPSGEDTYDEFQQLWIDKKSGIPLVSSMKAHPHPQDVADKAVTLRTSQFGETVLTRSQEGADQTEGSSFQASRFGETSMSKTQEGADQAEALHASRFGETSFTEAREGADQTEAPAFNASRFGETTMTKAPEGTDQLEVLTDQTFHAPYSHF